MKIECGNATPTLLETPVVTLIPPVRMKRAFTALGLSWLGALCFIPIPGLHFVMVPGLFIFGIYIFIKRLRETEKLELANVPCPNCGVALKTSTLYFGQELPRIYCLECRHHLWLTT